MFKLLRRFASKPERSPREAALRALECGSFLEAEHGLAALLELPDIPGHERAFLLNKRGVALVSLGDRERAREQFVAALEASARLPSALTNLGNLALERGDIEQAVAYYEEALASDDTYALAHLNIAAAYRRQGRISDAVRSLRKAQRLEGRFGWKPSKRP
ncbi:MAG: tetratricopeptide repeat protein [Vulcanimicrobiaceae bacterium]